MATIDDPYVIQNMIDTGGHPYDDEPAITRITKYLNMWDGIGYGVEWANERIVNRYAASGSIRNPEVIFTHPEDCDKCKAKAS